MTPALHARASEIFLAAVDLAAGERIELLDRACAEDPPLRREVESLLARDAGPAVVDQPPPAAGLREAIQNAEVGFAVIPRRIGNYEILNVLGQGGMGTVYRAQQMHPARLVALKVLRSAVVSPTLLRRFEFETTILARLQHPGIAQIYESGIADEDGRRVPFFAMELVEGSALTDFANQNRLTTRDRLALLLKVANAVQHAHQKGVIHRDIKPSNILVAEQPKVLDFGVARAIDADLRTTTLATRAGQIVGTLPYMSPEQVAGDPSAVDTRTDVYSLGVTAFELLTGRLPYDLHDKPLPDAARMIQDTAPAKLSAIHRAWRGDLETIIAKALEKEKDRRYASVSDFAADIQRFLHDEPIAARPPSRMYQFRKFARRNRLLVASTTAALVFLITAVVGTAIGWSRASAAESTARRKQAESEAVSQFLVRILMTPAPGAQGREVTVIEALEVARSQVETAFPDQPEARAAVLGELGAVYHALGRPQESLPYLRKAYELRRDVLGDNHAETLLSINNLGVALIDPNDPAKMKEAEVLLQRALEVARVVHGAESVQAAGAHNALANACWALGDHQRAETLTGEALRIGRKAGPDGDPIALDSMVNLAAVSGQKGDNQTREAQLREVLALRERTQSADHPHVLETELQLANTLASLKRHLEAELLYVKNIEKRTRILGEDHPDTLTSVHQYAVSLYQLGQRERGETLLRQALARERAALGAAHHLTGATLTCLADVLFRTDRYSEAQECYQELAATSEGLQGSDAPNTLVNLVWLALCISEQGRLDKARSILDDAALRIKPDDPGFTYARRLLSVAQAKQRWTRGDFEPAAEALRRVKEEFRQDWGKGHICTRLCQMYLAQLYEAWNKPDEAAAWKAMLLPETGDSPG